MDPDPDNSPPGERPPHDMPWFRTYRSDLRNVTLQRLPLALFKTAVNLRGVAEHLSGRLPSIKQIAFELHLTEKKTEEHLDALVAAMFLKRKGSIVFIADWRQCESDDVAARKRNQRLSEKCPVTRPRIQDETSSGTQTDTCPGEVTGKNRIDEEKKREDNLGAEPSAPRKPSRRIRLAGDAQPNAKDRESAAKAQLTEADFRTEWVRFRDFHVAKGTLMADWNAAWRTWLGNRGNFSRGRHNAPPSPPLSPFTAAAADILRTQNDLHRDHDQCPNIAADAYTTHGFSRFAQSEEWNGDECSGPVLDLVAQRPSTSSAQGDGNATRLH